MEFTSPPASIPGQIDYVKIGAESSHTSIPILINMVGRTIYVVKLTMMPHGVTPPILANDGKNVIAKKSYKFLADLKSNKLLSELKIHFCHKMFEFRLQ